MLLQPGRNGLDCAVGKQINGPTSLQITDQGSIAQSAFPCPIIETNDVWLWLGGLFRLANQAQDRIATPADTELTSNIRSCLAPYCESKLTEGLLQPFRALRMRTAEIWKSFNENLLSTGALFTAKTTEMHDEMDWTPHGGKIAQCPCIATLDARRCSPT